MDPPTATMLRSATGQNALTTDDHVNRREMIAVGSDQRGERAGPPSGGGRPAPVMEIADLQTQFLLREGVVRAVDGFSCTLGAGETLGIVGESGCGKSMTALSILRLVPDPPGRIVGGSIRLDGRELLTLSDAEMRRVRGNEISMVFQEPMTSLNPVVTIGRQISEVITLHQGLSSRAALEKTSRCSRWSVSPSLSGGSTNIRMRCPAACASE